MQVTLLKYEIYLAIENEDFLWIELIAGEMYGFLLRKSVSRQMSKFLSPCLAVRKPVDAVAKGKVKTYIKTLINNS